MRLALQIVSWVALAATALAPALYVVGQIELLRMQLIMLLATIVWFATTPFWMGQPKFDEEPTI